ncbi:hypothetical protein [Streptomyces sp. OE57]|uniref:hypothetical protein n=1 Tax=Streptomyces lacaronensis TaxID=3379885 RepID=UPI0039B7888E
MARHVSLAAVNSAVRPIEDFSGFVSHVKDLLTACEGADLVVFPELCTVELLTTLPYTR